MGGSLMSRRTYSIGDAPAFESNRERRAKVGAFAKRDARAASLARKRREIGKGRGQ